ncbi:MAG: hypothetical protein R3249_04055 [Nitriliruptorales bacterium]|nr:hypothetical protein [Nitriliruptorales bacterium]
MTGFMAATEIKPTWGKGRRITFYVAVGLSLLVLAGYPPILAGPVVAWLDGETLDALFSEEGLVIHRVHIEGATLLFWLTIVAMVSQFRRPEARPAPLLAAAAAWVVFLPVEFTHLVDPFTVIITTLVVGVVALHPRRWPEQPIRWRSRPLAVAGFGSLLALAYFIQELRLQLMGSAGDPHVDDTHYGIMAALAVGIAVSAVLGASDVPGHRISTWSAAIITVALGAFFIGHTEYASAVPAGWGVLMIAWAAVYLWLTTQPSDESEDDRVSV